VAVSVILKYTGKKLNIDTTKTRVAFISSATFSDAENQINEAQIEIKDLKKVIRNTTPPTKEDTFEMWFKRDFTEFYCGKFSVSSIKLSKEGFTITGNGVNPASLIKKQNEDEIYRDTSAAGILKKIAEIVGMKHQYDLPKDYPIMSISQNNRTYGDVIREVAEIYCGAKSKVENDTIIIYEGVNPTAPKVIKEGIVSPDYSFYTNANEVFGCVELTWNSAKSKEIKGFYGDKDAKKQSLSDISFPNEGEGNRLAKNIYFAQNRDIDTLSVSLPGLLYDKYYCGDVIKAVDFDVQTDGTYDLKSVNYAYSGQGLECSLTLERAWRLDT